MRTPNNLTDDNEIVIQIMPLPAPVHCGRYSQTDYDTLVVDDDGNRYVTVGLALTNMGSIYPIGYDYFSRCAYIFDAMPDYAYHNGTKYQWIADD